MKGVAFALLFLALLAPAYAAPPGFADADHAAYSSSLQLPASGSADVSLSIDATIYWGTAYYLDGGQWVSLPLTGTSVAGTNWKQGPLSADAEIPASALADEQRLIILLYACDQTLDGGWSCSMDADGNAAWELIEIDIVQGLPPGPGEPGAVCGNGVCESGETSESCGQDCPVVETCVDDDNDGYYGPGGFCPADDCDDNNADVNPGMAEIQGDGIDNNCDGILDEVQTGWPTYLHDNQRTGVADGKGPAQGKILWQVQGKTISRDSAGRVTEAWWYDTSDGVLRADNERIYVTMIRRPEVGTDYYHIAALDAKTGDTKWEYQMPLCTDGLAGLRTRKTARPRDIIIDGDKIYVTAQFCAQLNEPFGSGGGFLVLDATNGQLTGTVFNSDFKFYDVPISSKEIVVSNGMIYYNSFKKYLVAVDVQTSTIKWKAQLDLGSEGGSISHLLLHDTKLYVKGVKSVASSDPSEDEIQKSYIAAFDPTTGRKLSEKIFDERMGFGPLVADGDYFYTSAKMTLYRIHRETGVVTAFTPGSLAYIIGPTNTYDIWNVADTADGKIIRYHNGDVQPYVMTDSSGKIRWIANYQGTQEGEIAIASTDAFYDVRDIGTATYDRYEVFAIDTVSGETKWVVTLDDSSHADSATVVNGVLYLSAGGEGDGAKIVAIQ